MLVRSIVFVVNVGLGEKSDTNCLRNVIYIKPVKLLDQENVSCLWTLLIENITN